MGKEVTEPPQTPKRVDEQVVTFCKTLSSLEPQWVPVKPWAHAIPVDCFRNVPAYVKKHGGAIQIGWMIWEKRNLWLEAEFHACLFAKGKYVDITPKPDNEKTILFLPDPVSVFEDKMVPSKLFATSSNPLVKELVEAHQEVQNFKCKVLKGVPFGTQKSLSGVEMETMRALMKKKTDLEVRVFKEV